MTSQKPLTPADLQHAAQQFQIAGELRDVRSLQRGHIHDTFISTWHVDGEDHRFLHQRNERQGLP